MNLSNLSLPPELEAFIKNGVESGNYQTENEVIREALRLLWQRDRLRQIRLEELREEIKVGLDELDRGGAEPLDIEQIKAEVRDRLGEESETT